MRTPAHKEWMERNTGTQEKAARLSEGLCRWPLSAGVMEMGTFRELASEMSEGGSL